MKQAGRGETDQPHESPGEDRTNLARFRTARALDRTTLAWVRTELTMATFGFGMIGFFRTVEEKYPSDRTSQLHQSAIKFGIALVIIGIGAAVLSGISHLVFLRRLERDQPLVVNRWPLSVTVAFLLAILGFAGLWAALTP